MAVQAPTKHAIATIHTLFSSTTHSESSSGVSDVMESTRYDMPYAAKKSHNEGHDGQDDCRSRAAYWRAAVGATLTLFIQRGVNLPRLRELLRPALRRGRLITLAEDTEHNVHDKPSEDSGDQARQKRVENVATAIRAAINRGYGWSGASLGFGAGAVAGEPARVSSTSI